MGYPVIMKILPVFLLVLFFSGFLIFSYMAWITFRGRDDILINLGGLSIAGLNNKQNGPNQVFMGDGDQLYASNRNNPLLAKPKSSSAMKDEVGLQGLSTVDEDKLLGVDAHRAIQNLKMRVISKLRRHLLNGSKVKGHINQYGVNFTQLKPRSKVDREEIICRIKKLSLNIVNENTSPLLKGKVFPNQPLFSESSDYDEHNPEFSETVEQALYRSCAVIPNSAALDGAKHGLDIDAHDFILRFNNAPTSGYEEDVGSLTSMRIVNSQVVTKPHFKFPYSYLFPDDASNNGSNALQNVQSDILWAQSKKYMIWDPCNYSSTFDQWYSKPDFPFFEKYFNLTGRKKSDRNRFYILDCRVIWKLWELLQEFTFARIYGNPPTSGFIGIILALQKCERVNIYEYIPSTEQISKSLLTVFSPSQVHLSSTAKAALYFCHIYATNFFCLKIVTRFSYLNALAYPTFSLIPLNTALSTYLL
ncbi:unnamed protein product [Allacma fusca]|uniref:Beta-galactoside alpha-2,6-sialyltransferase 2 n=1 Tax=Allacma fusca TaxID=39272 RepID=A0A8J2PEP5_9HEXA|nr:unnamed protein product [Allacma fusca]